MFFENTQTATFSVLFRQPEGDIEPFEKFLMETFSQIKYSNK